MSAEVRKALFNVLFDALHVSLIGAEEMADAILAHFDVMPKRDESDDGRVDGIHIRGLVEEARTPIYATASDEAWKRNGTSPADRDDLIARLADALEDVEHKFRRGAFEHLRTLDELIEASGEAGDLSKAFEASEARLSQARAAITKAISHIEEGRHITRHGDTVSASPVIDILREAFAEEAPEIQPTSSGYGVTPLAPDAPKKEETLAKPSIDQRKVDYITITGGTSTAYLDVPVDQSGDAIENVVCFGEDKHSDARVRAFWDDDVERWVQI